MALIDRTIYLNPVEPAPFSFRAPSGLQTQIRVQIYNPDGSVLSEDLGLQLQLTSRSENTITSYIMPSIDVVNGKAMATIGAEDLTDINGYNVHVYGTWRGGAELLGRGVLRLTGGPGLMQQPEDIIDDVPLTLAYTYDVSFTVRLWQDTGKTIPYDLASTSIGAAIYAAAGNPVALATFATASTTLPGEVLLTMPATVVNTLPPSCWWSLTASTSLGITTLAQGTVTITGTLA